MEHSRRLSERGRGGHAVLMRGSGEGNRLTSPVDRSRAVPIGDYGFLSDGEVSALVAPGGSVDWMCVPRFDSPSAFGRILGRQAGAFRIAPLDVTVPSDRRYLPGTMILETSWGTPTGRRGRPR